MSTRWKPKIGQQYWIVGGPTPYVEPWTWFDNNYDAAVFSFGNCFQTREQAEAALEKIKQVLKEWHDDN